MGTEKDGKGAGGWGLWAALGWGQGRDIRILEQQIRKSHQHDPGAGRILLLYFKTIANAALHLGFTPQRAHPRKQPALPPVPTWLMVLTPAEQRLH